MREKIIKSQSGCTNIISPWILTERVVDQWKSICGGVIFYSFLKKEEMNTRIITRLDSSTLKGPQK